MHPTLDYRGLAIVEELQPADCQICEEEFGRDVQTMVFVSLCQIVNFVLPRRRLDEFVVIREMVRAPFLWHVGIWLGVGVEGLDSGDSYLSADGILHLRWRC